MKYVIIISKVLFALALVALSVFMTMHGWFLFTDGNLFFLVDYILLVLIVIKLFFLTDKGKK